MGRFKEFTESEYVAERSGQLEKPSFMELFDLFKNFGILIKMGNLEDEQKPPNPQLAFQLDQVG